MAAIIVTICSAQAPAQCTEQQKLTASDAAALDSFGSVVSVSGDTAVIGTESAACDTGFRCGSAYVFRFNGSSWVEEQKLTASDATAGDHFGSSVSASGETIVVGAVQDDCAAGFHCGSAYVFRFNGAGWVEEQKLTASDAAALGFFGDSVSVDGDTALVGASNDECAAGALCGSAYVFRFNGTSWVEEQKLSASDGSPLDQFGWSVSLSGDTAVVGAFLDDCAMGTRCGSAYLFRFNGISWIEEQKLIASDVAALDQFGSTVSLSGNTVVVGAVGNDCAGGFSCGSAYVFRFNGTNWVEEQKLTASDAAHSDGLGASVSVVGNMVVVGAGGDDCAAGDRCGSAYLFRFNGTSWDQEQKLTASDGAPGDGFGRSVAVNAGRIVVGAFDDNCAAGRDCGSAYVFRCEPTCGDDNLDPGEECDGLNNATCPGACLSDCTCGPFCGDGTCDPGVDSCSCPADCGLPPSSELPGSTCTDGLDNDCDGVIDSDDPDCAAPPIPAISAWGMIAVTLLLLAIGKIVFRKTANVSGSA